MIVNVYDSQGHPIEGADARVFDNNGSVIVICFKDGYEHVNDEILGMPDEISVVMYPIETELKVIRL